MSPEEQQKNTIYILLVEDNEDDVVIIRDMLGQLDGERFDLRWARDLREAESAVNERAPQIILLDLGLPDAGANGAVQRLQSDYPSIPIIVLTGNDDRTRAFEAIRIGAEDYLIKGKSTPPLLERAILYAIERKKVKTELSKANQSLRELVDLDPLTNVLNRRGLQEVLKKIRAEKGRSGIDFHAILIDLDDFKMLNEKYGYGIGDLALKEVCKIMSHTIRENDYVGRVGGDEFVVLISARMEEALFVADKLLSAISQSLIMIDTEDTVRLSCSMGVGALDEDCEILEGLIRKLESSLRKGKALGKNRVVGQEGFLSQGSSRQDPRTLPPFSLETENFYAVCQPIYELHSKNKIAYEMLTRIRHETIQNLSDLFLYARHHNLLTYIDFKCFKTCLREASKLPADSQVHVNLLPSTVATLKSDPIIEESDRVGMGKKICIELSEQQVVGAPSYLLEEINKFKGHGISIAIDDVGFGYSSLETLVILQPQWVKIDICCIRGIAADAAKQAQFRRLVKVVEACEAQYIVEGIENEPDFDFLLRSSVRYGQGFLLARPDTL